MSISFLSVFSNECVTELCSFDYFVSSILWPANDNDITWQSIFTSFSQSNSGAGPHLATFPYKARLQIGPRASTAPVWIVSNFHLCILSRNFLYIR